MEILIGVITGIASAALFHIMLRRLKPKIMISDKIVREKVIKNGNTIVEYRIKIVNCRPRSIVNIKTFVNIVRLEDDTDGIVYFHGKLPSFDDDLPYIAPYRKNDCGSQYAVWPRLPSELEDKWGKNNNNQLIVRIYCMDSFSGADAMFSQTYGTDAIVDGQFKTGKSLDVVPNIKM